MHFCDRGEDSLPYLDEDDDKSNSDPYRALKLVACQVASAIVWHPWL